LVEYNKIYTVEARKGKARKLALNEKIKIINTHGSQCVDTWAFNSQNFDEFMSMEHTRATLDKMMPDIGEAFLTNCRRPILTIVDDTSPGVHDTLNAACDIYRYNLLGHKGYHDNCTDNLKESLGALDLVTNVTPCPFNLFSNRPWSESRQLYKKPPVSKPGDSFTMRAEMDCVVVLSSCPQDMNETNGADQTPKEFNYIILT
tara:strand:- start:155 stop:763 length:609 start_codon:yes stop_codon:yes gene_type:complete